MKVYEKKSFPRTARDFKTMYEKGNLSFDNAVQRSFVWKNTSKDNRMSMLIDSMLRGFPVPPMYCNCIFEDVKNKMYDFLDGKQRTTTIIKFLNNEFSLAGIPIFEEEDGEEIDLNGKTYSELPEEYQDRVKTYNFVVYYYENMEQDDAEDMFRRLNNGKSLTAIELSRSKAASRHDIFEMGKHEIFNIALSEKALVGRANEDIIVKVWVTLFSEKKSLEKRYTNPIMENTKISGDEIVEIIGIFDSFVKLYGMLVEDKEKKVIRKILNKTNLISLSSVLQKAIKNEDDIKNVKDWMVRFYSPGTKNMSINIEYNDISRGRIAVTEKAVIARRDILLKDYEEFLKRV